MAEVLERVAAQPPPAPVFEQVEPSAWPQQGEWGYDDYLRLPDDGNRYEIIDGALYMTPAPGFDHQFFVAEFFLALGLWKRSQPGTVVLTAPFEIHLSKSSRPLQPDIVYFGAEARPEAGAKFFEGVPTLVVEVLSTGSVRTDRLVKFDAYERAGVSEYWIANPATRSVEVYVLGDDGLYTQLGEYQPGETARSAVLRGFSVDVKSLFPD